MSENLFGYKLNLSGLNSTDNLVDNTYGLKVQISAETVSDTLIRRITNIDLEKTTNYTVSGIAKSDKDLFLKLDLCDSIESRIHIPTPFLFKGSIKFLYTDFKGYFDVSLYENNSRDGTTNLVISNLMIQKGLIDKPVFMPAMNDIVLAIKKSIQTT